MLDRWVIAALVAGVFALSCAGTERSDPSDQGGVSSGTGSGADGGGATGGTSASSTGDSSSSASAGGSGSGGDGPGGGAPGPNPPAGSRLCGEGTFTASDASQACAAEPVTPTSLPPASCDLLGIEGGAWEVWCSETTLVYLWARFDGAAVPDAGMLLTLDGGLPNMLLEAMGETVVGTNAVPLVSVYVADTETDVSLDFDLADQLSGAMLPAGSGQLWVTGMYSDATSIFEQVLVSGVAFDWQLP